MNEISKKDLDKIINNWYEKAISKHIELRGQAMKDAIEQYKNKRRRSK